MRILQAYNLHRGFGGSDIATRASIAALGDADADVHLFERDSKTLPPGLLGRVRAFTGGLYARDAVRDFRHELERLRPDVVHVGELYPMISPWILPCCRDLGIPVVMNTYDFRLSCPIATHYTRGAACHKCVGGREYWCVARNCRDNILESTAFALRNASARHFRLYLDNVDLFLAPSASTREDFIRFTGVEPERVDVHPCVVPVPETGVDDPAAGTYVGFAGRFVPEKGVEVLIQACRKAGLPLALAGNADNHPAVTPADDVEFVMASGAQQLAPFYRNARIMVVPSLWPETFGMVTAEAMSHGITTVVSRIGALPDTLGRQFPDLQVEPGDVDALAERLTTLWHDAERLRQCGRELRARVIDNFSAPVHARRLTDFYQRVIDAR